jgi:hypothetical protein
MNMRNSRGQHPGNTCLVADDGVRRVVGAAQHPDDLVHRDHLLEAQNVPRHDLRRVEPGGPQCNAMRCGEWAMAVGKHRVTLTSSFRAGAPS